MEKDMTTNFMQQVGVPHCFHCHKNHEDILIHYPNINTSPLPKITPCTPACRMYDGTPVLERHTTNQPIGSTVSDEPIVFTQKMVDDDIARMKKEMTGRMSGTPVLKEKYVYLDTHASTKTPDLKERCPCPFHNLMYKCPLFVEEKI